MASCVLLLLLLLSLVSLFAAAFFFLRAVRKEKSCESISRENESLFSCSLQSGFLFVCHQFFYCWGV